MIAWGCCAWSLLPDKSTRQHWMSELVSEDEDDIQSVTLHHTREGAVAAHRRRFTRVYSTAFGVVLERIT